MGKTAHFCPNCGAPTGGEPVLVAETLSGEESTGSAVDAQTGEQNPEENAAVASGPAAWFLDKKHRIIIAATTLVVLLVVALGAVIVTSVQAQQRQVEAAARAAEELNSSFDALMGLRGQVLTAEATINDSFDRANAKSDAYLADVQARKKQAKSGDAAYKKRLAEVKRHNANEDKKHRNSYYYYSDGYNYSWGYGYLQKYWVAPPKPKAAGTAPAPSLSEETNATRSAVASLTSVLATLTANQPEDELRSMRSQLKEVVNTLVDAGNHNADVMATAVKGPTSFDTASLEAMREGVGTALFSTLNDTVIGFIKARHLDIRVYDIAGGRDSSPSDSSMLTSAATTDAVVAPN
jgi:hypothetical protein